MQRQSKTVPFFLIDWRIFGNLSVGVESTQTGPELTFVTHDMGGHLDINKTYDLGEWLGQKRRKKNQSYINKGNKFDIILILILKKLTLR